MSQLLAWLEVCLPNVRRSIQLLPNIEIWVGRHLNPPPSVGHELIFIAEIDERAFCCIQRSEVSRGHLRLLWNGDQLEVQIRSERNTTRIGTEIVPFDAVRTVPAGTPIHLAPDIYVWLRVERDTSRVPVVPPPLPLPDDPSGFMALLPEIYHNQDFLRRYLLIFESLWAPLEWRQDHIEAYFDPATCPIGMLDWLASWVGVQLDSSLPERTQRRIVQEARRLYHERGTLKGLREMIRISAGIDEAQQVEIESVGDFIVRVRVTRGEGERRTADALRERIEPILKAHKPAHVAYHLEVK